MIKRREIALAIILTIVTCGIYGMYWCVIMVDDVNKLSKNESQFSGVIVLLLSIVTCGIFALYYFYKMGDTIDRYMVENKGAAPGSKGILYLLLCLIGFSIVSMALIQNDLNTIADDFNNNGGTYAGTIDVIATTTTYTSYTDTPTASSSDAEAPASNDSASGVSLDK